MAANDMEMIVYKILKYLYDCNKKGKVPTFSDMFQMLEVPSIPQSYLGQILSELLDKGYISGCSVTQTKNGIAFQIREEAAITMDGVTYLHDNSVMKKLEKIAGKAFEIVLEATISAAMPR